MSVIRFAPLGLTALGLVGSLLPAVHSNVLTPNAPPGLVEELARGAENGWGFVGGRALALGLALGCALSIAAAVAGLRRWLMISAGMVWALALVATGMMAHRGVLTGQVHRAGIDVGYQPGPGLLLMLFSTACLVGTAIYGAIAPTRTGGQR